MLICRLFFLIYLILMFYLVFLGDAEAKTRSYRLGFSPWPYDYSLEAVDWVYQTINRHGDIVSQHIEEGVPWDEALRNDAFPSGELSDIRLRLDKMGRGRRVLLQLNPINIKRDGLAPYRGEKDNQPLPESWQNKRLNDKDVKKAYLQYVRTMKAYFKPEFLITGVEVNLYMRNQKERWQDYVELQCYVYRILKEKNPHENILVSLFAPSFFPEWIKEDNLEDQLQAIKDLEPCVDGFAISVHPFMSALLADSFPSNYFDRLHKRIPKVWGVSESSYPAQKWSLYWMTWKGTPEKQNTFVEHMLGAAERYNYKFVIWYAVRDYDALWNNALQRSDLALVWRDTGFYDEDGLRRLALETWNKALLVPYSP